MTNKILIFLLLFSLKFNAQVQYTNTTNSGNNATAIGESTVASGDKAVAMGGYTDATGGFSTAMGRDSQATGNSSTAMGEWAVAAGHRSTAIGYRVTASDYASLVIGSWNLSGSSITTNGNALDYDADNTAFVIGNGTASNSKSDAFKVMFNGNTTIGGDDLTIGDLSAFSGSFTQRSAIDVVAHSDGDLMTGYINGSTGDRFNIELDAGNSLAKISSGGGYDLTFSTEGGTMNFESNGFGTGTYAFNGNTTVSNDLTIGDLSAFSGSFTQRSAIDVVAHSDGDLMTGYINGSTGDRFNIELDAGNSLAKISSGGGYDLTFSTEGGTMNFESNGFGTGTYAFNGNTTVSNDLTVSGDVVVSSDARLKANIISLGSTLSKLLLIDGKSYTMKKNGKQKIGVLAQDIQKVFPELVSEDANKMLAVNYQGLVPVLINALKEQQAEINKLKEQEQRLEKLEKLIYQMKK